LHTLFTLLFFPYLSLLISSLGTRGFVADLVLHCEGNSERVMKLKMENETTTAQVFGRGIQRSDFSLIPPWDGIVA
jgi:hypothetical protein